MRAATCDDRSAAARSDEAARGRALPALLDEAVRRNPNPRALNELTAAGPRSLSTEAFRDAADEVALGLRALGLVRGDRVGLMCPSGIDFAVADMGCLVAGLVDVPVHESFPRELVVHALRHTDARAVFVQDSAALARAAECAEDLPELRHVIVADASSDAVARRAFPGGAAVITLDELRARGRSALAASRDAPHALRSALRATDAATIVFTSGTTGPPKGVVLTHGNVSFDATSAFSILPAPRSGPAEVALSILPFAHAYARTLHYGYVHRGATVHFTRADRLVESLRQVRPTMVAVVPRVLEKLRELFVAAGAALPAPRRQLFDWALRVASEYDVERPKRGLRLRLADALVLARWREATGGRLRHVFTGGAAIDPELVALLGAARIPVLQGYGLTEASPIITCHRDGDLRPDTVGPPIPGVEVRIAPDGEVLTRGPHVMRGYWRDPDATREAIDVEGWLHTGDVGKLTADGHLVLTDRKKELFKLATGEFIAPRQVEILLQRSPLVDWACVTGEGRSVCSALIFPGDKALRRLASAEGVDAESAADIVRDARVVARFDEVVAEANSRLPRWSAVRAFRLVPDTPTEQNGLVSATMKLRRARVRKQYADEIAAMYDDMAVASAKEQMP